MEELYFARLPNKRVRPGTCRRCLRITDTQTLESMKSFCLPSGTTQLKVQEGAWLSFSIDDTQTNYFLPHRSTYFLFWFGHTSHHLYPDRRR